MSHVYIGTDPEGRHLTIERASSLFLGKGKGKTQTLINLCLDDIHNGTPVVFIDPHGDAVAQILRHIPKVHNVLLIEPSRAPFALNLFDRVPREQHALLSSTILKAISQNFPSDIPTTRIDKYIGTAIQTLLSVSDSDLLGVLLFLTDMSFRKKTLRNVDDPFLTYLWHGFDAMTPKEQREKTESSESRLLSFMKEPCIRHCIGQEKNHLSFKDTVVLVSLKEAQLGAENARMFGALILTQLYMETLRGVTTTLYVDEGQRFPMIVPLLSQLPTLFTVQFLSQLRRERDSVLGAVEQIVAFRTSRPDAEFLDPDLEREHDNVAPSLTKLPDYSAYLNRGMSTVQFFTRLHTHPRTSYGEKIITYCAKQHSASLSHIEKRIGRYF